MGVGLDAQGGALAGVFELLSQPPSRSCSWSDHITYPQMAYDSPLHRYLLAFTYSYGADPTGHLAQRLRSGDPRGAAIPWGPFSFVAHESFFGPANGYGAGFPLGWIPATGVICG